MALNAEVKEFTLGREVMSRSGVGVGPWRRATATASLQHYRVTASASSLKVSVVPGLPWALLKMRFHFCSHIVAIGRQTPPNSPKAPLKKCWRLDVNFSTLTKLDRSLPKLTKTP